MSKLITSIDTIDPRKLAAILAAVALGLQYLGSNQVDWAHMLPGDWAPYIKTWCGTLSGLCIIIIGGHSGLDLMTTSVTNTPRQPTILPPVPPAAHAILFLLAVGSASFFLLMVSPAMADPKKSTSSQANPIGDLIDQVGQNKTALNQSQIAKFLNDLADFDDAATLSTQIDGLHDNVGAACWKQFGSLQQLIKAHPLPATFKLASDFEALRLNHLALNKICGNTNCLAMWQDVSNAAGAISGVPLPISLVSICAKIPVISQWSDPGMTPPAAPIPPAPAPAK